MLLPTLHKHFELGTRVKTKENSGLPLVTGKIVGISSIHIIFTYIILLDPECHITDEYGTHEAIAAHGTLLEAL